MCMRRMRLMFLCLQSAATQLFFRWIDGIAAQFNCSETKRNFKTHHMIYADSYLRQAPAPLLCLTVRKITQKLTDFYETLKVDRAWEEEQSIWFWDRSGLDFLMNL